MFNLSHTTLYSMACSLLPCLVYLWITRRRRTRLYTVLVILFALYIWQVLDVTGAGGLADVIFAPQGGITQSPRINLVPLRRINLSFMKNILMCMPLGMLLPLIWREWRRPLPTLCFGALFSLGIELSQLMNTRLTDVDDLIANTVGTLVGYVLWYVIWRLLPVLTKRSSSPHTEHEHEALWIVALSYLGSFFLYYPQLWYQFIG